MSEYDQRQYRIMLHKLGAFETGHVSLGTLHALSANLMALLGVLEAQDPAWERRFLGEWGELDVAYSVALVQSCGEDPRAIAAFVFDDEEIRALRAVAHRLKLLVLEKVEAPNESDDTP